MLCLNRVAHPVQKVPVLKKMEKKAYLVYKKRFTSIQMIKSYNNLIKYNRIT
jgi:hypothetical protein